MPVTCRLGSVCVVYPHGGGGGGGGGGTSMLARLGSVCEYMCVCVCACECGMEQPVCGITG